MISEEEYKNKSVEENFEEKFNEVEGSKIWNCLVFSITTKHSTC